MADWNSSLVRDLVRAVAAGLDTIDAISDEITRDRAAAETLAAVVKDPKFCDAWADPEFQTACFTALKSRATEEIRREKMSRLVETIAARVPEGKTVEECFTESEFTTIAADYGLTKEDLEQLWRENEFKFNN